ncbi:hypothetical protein [Pseudomonas sp. PB3P13]
MTTDRQKSFIATLGTPTSALHFLDVIHGQPATVMSSLISGGFFTGRPQARDDSHFLGLGPDVPMGATPKLTLYFRYIGPGYRLYIRTTGDYYGMCLSTDDAGLLGAFAATGSKNFNLIGTNGAIVNLNDIQKDANRIYLQVKDSGLVHAHKVHDSRYHYIADQGGAPLAFDLHIQQRNAPYIRHPDEV